METSAESPVPVRTVLQAVGGWIGRLGRIWVEGQITELNRRGGTVYLTLRDPVANMSVRVVGQRAVFDAAGPAVTDGARVVVHARPDFWINRGTFSLNALEVKPVGVGELLARLERLKGVLAAEGLFNPERRRPLPFLPRRIGLICGRDSDAEHDVLQNARRRWPAVRFRIENTAVQGTHAVGEIMAALRGLDADPDIDVIVITRGGGAMEDLLPFSDEALVRAVAATRTPVVSAIGHEQDAPLLDLVADLRASTPTDAAKRVVPDVREQLQLVRRLRDQGRRCVAGRLDREAAWLESVRTRPALADPVQEVERQAEQALALRDRARRALAGALDRAGDHLAHTRARLVALSPAATLRRGYAIAQLPDGSVLRSAADAAVGDELLVRLADGRLAVTVTGPAEPAPGTGGTA
ncbi:exodeoxyribonuclease VII large subunit [Actinomadura craniellae]|uniref:Exodeoxyribonuclease 7 large subunit n=2 Tax=Actinomadura craniellae TaxID=2231787 RepID=A0A365H5K6_9ACTN|nr:exodeoxyribonuclease VII large subunit [Actinomadura craniellae]